MINHRLNPYIIFYPFLSALIDVKF